jgi:ABC-2 type transport system permease protein
MLQDFQGFQLIMNFLVMPLYFLSGALFPLKDVPFWLDIISRLNPLAYGVDGLRAALINVSQYGLITDCAVLIVLTLVILTIGSYLFSKIQV